MSPQPVCEHLGDLETFLGSQTSPARASHSNLTVPVYALEDRAELVSSSTPLPASPFMEQTDRGLRGLLAQQVAVDTKMVATASPISHAFLQHDLAISTSRGGTSFLIP